MKYKEILELYTDGKLPKEEAEKVEYDIDRQDAISEYLFDTESLDEEFEFDSATSSDEPRQKGAADAEGFAKEIKKSIRKAFIKAGAIAVAAAVAIVLLAQFALPGLVDKMYYQPNEEIKTTNKDFSEDRMTIDMDVYSEIFLPGKRFDSVISTGNGYGDYDLIISQSYYSPGNSFQVSGNLKRNKLTLYDNTVLEKPVVNRFEWPMHSLSTDGNKDEMDLDPNKSLSSQIKKDDQSQGVIGSKNQSKEMIKNLDDKEEYTAYINFEKLMDYDDAYKIIHNEDIGNQWIGVRTSKYGYSMQLYGFKIHQSGIVRGDEYNKAETFKKYKNLFVDGDDCLKDEKLAKEHFISLLEYYRDQKTFRKIMEEKYLGSDNEEAADEELDERIKYLKKNSLKVYGFACRCDKKYLLKLIDSKDIYTISVEE